MMYQKCINTGEFSWREFTTGEFDEEEFSAGDFTRGDFPRGNSPSTVHNFLINYFNLIKKLMQKQLLAIVFFRKAV